MLGTQLIAPAVRFAMRMGQKKRPPRYVALKIVSALLIGVAAVFALISLHGYLRLHFSAVAVNAIFSGGFAVLALGILLGVRIAQNRYRAPTLTEHMREEVSETGAQIMGLHRDMYRSILRNEKTWLLAAGVLGIMMGANARGKRRKSPPKS